MKKMLVSMTDAESGETVLVRMQVEEGQIVESLWPKDLTICKKCKRDLVLGHHAIGWNGEVVCLQ